MARCRAAARGIQQWGLSAERREAFGMEDDVTSRGKVLVAGATGVIGRRLVPLLLAAGYEVVGTTRDPSKADQLLRLGAGAVVVDAFGRDGLLAALEAARPHAVIHQLTDLRERDLAANARLRIEGTRNLVDAASAVGVRRMVAQSIAFAYAPGDGPAREKDPLDVDAPSPRRETVLGVQALEQAVLDLPEGVVLRYGLLYGPGTWFASDGPVADQVRRGERAATDGVASFIHAEDAAQAALQALSWPPGVVNVVDDEPAPGRAWLPVYAAALGAPEPPVRSGSDRGERGASNAKARLELGWNPRYPSWRDGFRLALG
jgi:nucleoside-diphosphate-sugar epimerase